MSLDQFYQTIRAEIAKVVFGQDEVIDFALAALFSGGHVLLEGPPGVAKTLLVRTIAAALNLNYRRVQMTPDLLPNDITGKTTGDSGLVQCQRRQPTCVGSAQQEGEATTGKIALAAVEVVAAKSLRRFGAGVDFVVPIASPGTERGLQFA